MLRMRRRVGRWLFGTHYHCRMAGVVVVERMDWVWAVGECCRRVVAAVLVLTALAEEVRL